MQRNPGIHGFGYPRSQYPRFRVSISQHPRILVSAISVFSGSGIRGFQYTQSRMSKISDIAVPVSAVSDIRGFKYPRFQISADKYPVFQVADLRIRGFPYTPVQVSEVSDIATSVSAVLVIHGCWVYAVSGIRGEPWNLFRRMQRFRCSIFIYNLCGMNFFVMYR